MGKVVYPPVDHDGAICIVGGVGGAEDIGDGVWTRTDMFVEFGADGEGGLGCAGHGATCGRAGYDGVDGYPSRTERKAVYRPRKGYMRPGVIFKDEGNVGGIGKVGHEQSDIGPLGTKKRGSECNTHASWRMLLKPCPHR